MIKSMTAFASGETQIGNLTISCELRSVNHRYCDISFKLPENFRFAENLFRTSLAKQIKRGKIECYFNYKKQRQDGQAFKVDLQAVAALLATTAEIESLMQNPQPFSALDIVAFPGIQQEQEIDKDIVLSSDLHSHIQTYYQEELQNLEELLGRRVPWRLSS